MDKVATLAINKRKELFQESSAALGISSAIIEKDFWVCWILKNIFTSKQLKSHLVFKGGTSLSKVYNLIERFSEDVDLILDWGLLGYGGVEDPYQEHPSYTKQDRFNKEFNRRAAEYIKVSLCPRIDALLSRCPGVKATVDKKDSQIINVRYPAAFSEKYLRPEVRLEIGPLASLVPRGGFRIKPYAAEAFPDVFESPECPVVAIKAERTFWEKATILHKQAHRIGTLPPRYSRHYYDMYRLAGSKFKTNALGDLKLLEDVAQFKIRFYKCLWARYEDARPGTFKLVPKGEHIGALKKDYRQMEVMIFGEAPEFDRILETLAYLENEINGYTENVHLS
jgi:hypothetical protein